MDDRVSREAKLNAAKEIVSTYIKSSVVRSGEHEQRLTLSSADVCNLFREVFSAIDDAIPSVPRKAGF